MKTIAKNLSFLSCVLIISCTTQDAGRENSDLNAGSQAALPGQSGVKDESSSPNIVQVAAGSKDHSTLVAAVKAAELVDALTNAGPFTVFAPVNEAFEKLPAGTVEGLLKPEKKADLANILEYHVSVGVYKAESFMDGQSLGQVNGGNIKINLQDGHPIINGKARILASVPASNGIIHVVDQVLLPE